MNNGRAIVFLKTGLLWLFLYPVKLTDEFPLVAFFICYIFRAIQWLLHRPVL